ncbi:plipastatin synthase subunit D [Ruminiclostridium hungatei]|uniref:Plipastatin synthase subunit D n=1 Tax=Ruminiclostridium hungatei TaxID=48256 RepID=A0A1V4SNU1_RUMHU|nr:non-ribosomal peptide synthetase [Ruminiclostridium hungatei]OPX45135.1 plipastatin synthase subunit D [Ruminiclostridium hungatei]
MIYTNIQGALKESFRNGSNRIAIEYGEQEYTYAQVDRASDEIAKSLLESGACKNSHIGVLTYDRSVLIATAIAIWKVAGIFIPLDPEYPQRRLQLLAETADIEYIVCGGNSFHLPGNREERKIRYMEFDDKIFHGKEIETFIPALDCTGEEPIYIYFSSGTTDKPKAIIGCNKSLMHFINWEIETFHMDGDTRVSQLTPPCHDPFLRDVFTTLVAGGTVCIPEGRKVILSPFELTRWADKSRINMIHCTPGVFRILCRGDLDRNGLQELRHVLLAGERLLSGDLTAWYARFGTRIQLVNLYGPTETTLAKLVYFITPDDLDKNYTPVGKAMKGAEALILNPAMQVCKYGEIGEIHIRTPYGTLGYYKNEELTRQKFLKTPTDSDSEAVIYKTGDLGRQAPDNNIEFVGRLDKQVKIRGFRVEIDEIEGALSRYPGVRICVVHFFERSFSESEGCLAAYYVSDEVLSRNSMLEYMKALLPEYMVPAYYCQMDAIPLTANGKTDYGKLPDPRKTVIKEAVSEPSSLEEKLLELWREILEIETIGTDDVFIGSGGDSMKIMLLVSRIYTEFNMELPLEHIFDDLTVDKLARLIKDGT